MPRDHPKSTLRLTEKQDRFAKEYTIEGNGTKSAIRAGYSPNVAAEMASLNLRNPKILAAIEKYREEFAYASGFDSMKVLKEMCMLAFSDMGDVQVDPDTGRLISDFPEARRSVQSMTISWDKDGVKVK